MTERQEFKVIRAYDDFELREYLPCVIAEVRVSAQYSTSTSSAFSTLFNYISKGNESSEKIAMTAPVITAQMADNSESDEWHVSFVMPAGRNIGQVPNPNNSQILLRELATEICVAKSFRGKATDDLARKITKELRASAAKENIALSNETRICRFDPPFKPGFFQYNEIVIPTNL
jgi:hypothetical protein